MSTFALRSLRLVCAGALPLLGAMPAVGSERDHEAQLRAYVEAWNSGDTAALDGIVNEDFVRHGNYGAANSREELGVLVRGFHRFYRDLRVDLLDSFAGAEKGGMRTRFRGGYGKTSFVIDSVNFSMVRFAHGKIAEEWVAGNTSDFWTGMGYRIMPPGTRMVPPPVTDPPGTHVPPAPDLGAAQLAAFAADARSRAPKNAGEIGIFAEVDCRLSLDREPIGGLEAGTSILLSVAPGAHDVRAWSRGGRTVHSESVKVKKGRIARVDVSAPARTLVDRANRTAEDLSTGLMWQLADNGGDITQKAAAAYCENASNGGYSDWRLPSIYELETLHAPETASRKRFQTIDGVSLSGCCPWTVSPHGDFHWTFVFYNGSRYIKHESIKKFSRALCVRHAG